MAGQTQQARRWWVLGVVIAGALASVGCDSTTEGGLPPDVQSPETIQTPAGALARYRGTVGTLAGAFDGVIFTSGVLTDELVALPLAVGARGQFTDLDSRQTPQFDPARLHRTRAQARESRGFLEAFAPDQSPALRGHLYAVEGYAEIFLADLYCSGIPLSTVDFDGNYTLAAGSTTSEVYRHAIELFDSALKLSADSVRLQYLAAIGKGRALLALGQYAAAAAAVATVPDGYTYQLSFRWGGGDFGSILVPPDSAVLMWYATRTSAALREAAPIVANQEGVNGLNYRLSGDPRTLAVGKGVASSGTVFYPRKYTNSAVTVANPAIPNPLVFTLANSIEARLTEAEAALQANPEDGVWLLKLNQLRQTSWSTIVPVDTSTNPPPLLTDPVDPAARVNLLFRERAFWLYLTAHRQGDLRRLVREYGRTQETVYPVGPYSGLTGFYGAEVVAPMPQKEIDLNPRYTGCVDRNA